MLPNLSREADLAQSRVHEVCNRTVFQWWLTLPCRQAEDLQFKSPWDQLCLNPWQLNFVLVPGAVFVARARHDVKPISTRTRT